MGFSFLPGIIRFMNWLRIQRICGGVLLLLCLGLAAWGFWPLQSAARSSPLYGKRVAVLSAPANGRCGDTVVIRLAIKEDETTAPAAGFWDKTSDPVEIEKSGWALIKARPEIAGQAIVPAGEMLEPLLPQHSLQFTWTLRPEKAGDVAGVIWLHMVSPAPPGPDGADTGSSNSLLLSMQPLDIQTVCPLGMQGVTARWLGVVGALIGLALIILHQ